MKNRTIKTLSAFATVSLILTGCQSSGDGGSDPATTEWDRLEEAQPAEVTVESVSTFFELSQMDKSTQSAVGYKKKAAGVFLGALNLPTVQIPTKSTMAAPPTVYTYENVINGSESGTASYKLTVNLETGETELTAVYDNYHNIDTTEIDPCGDPNVTKQNGTLYCNGTYDIDIDNMNPMQCTMQTLFSAGNVVFVKGSSFTGRDNDKDGEYEETYYNIAGVVEGQKFAYLDTNETIWDDSVYEYSLLTSGKIFFNDLSEYLMIDSSFDITDRPHISGLCNDVAYSGTLYLRGKDDALVELNITAENTMSISIDTDNDGTWDAVETKILESSTDMPPSIAGTWNLTTENGCSESYIFGADGSFTSYSASEIMTGTYIVGHQTENDRYPVTVSFVTDNQQPDCSGNTTSYAGEAATLYMTMPNASTMEFYSSDSDTTVYGTMYK